MKISQFYTLLALSIIALVLTVTLIVLGQGNQTMQQKLQAQQADIGRGNNDQQIRISMAKDIASASQKNPKLRDVLIRNGFTLNSAPTPSPSPSPTAAASVPTH